jgi:hypothetical protein
MWRALQTQASLASTIEAIRFSQLDWPQSPLGAELTIAMLFGTRAFFYNRTDRRRHFTRIAIVT